jgi:3-methyladenine DNA glycosylase AlkD
MAKTKSQRLVQQEVRAALSALEEMSTEHDMKNLARFGITASKAFGVSVANIQRLAGGLGRNHELAAALWDTGWYEARLLTSFVDEPSRVTPAQMDRWCRDFDSWAIVDTACFHLFDRTPHALAMVKRWATRRPEFEKRAAFALLACVALHDKQADEEALARCLPLIERAATDERNFVKKGVSWALRSVGRRSAALYGESIALARRLAASSDASARWIGRDALRDLERPAVAKRVATKRSAGPTRS